MMDIREREIVSDLILDIGKILNTGTCDNMRFCLVVWCDCADRPMYIGGNDDDNGRILKMLARAGQGVEACGNVVGGRA
jgi:hypothetical protein